MTDFLFSMPSFMEGVGRAIDMGGVLDQYNVSKTPAQADERATKEDWRAVGKDIRKAVRQHAGR